MSVHKGNNVRDLDHARHDALLVARFAMDDAYPGEQDQARTLIDECTECAAVAADVRLIAVALKSVPAPARPRDFTITADQADRLRGPRLARWLRAIAAPGWGTLRPVAGVALSIGMVMAAIGSMLPTYLPAAVLTEDAGAPAQPGIGAPAPGGTTDLTMSPEGQPDPTPALDDKAPVHASEDIPSPPAAEYMPVPSPEATDDTRAAEGGAGARPTTAAQVDGVPGNDVDDGTQAPPDTMRSAATGTPDTMRSLLVYGGLVMAVLSFALLALAWAARRFFADPLLR